MSHELKGSGYVLSDEENIVAYEVTDLGDNSKTTFGLKMKPGMWWKAIVLKHLVNGQEVQVFEIRTGDDKPEASIDVLASDMKGPVTIILGKAGKLALWKEAKRIMVDGDSLVGKKVVIDWQKD